MSADRATGLLVVLLIAIITTFSPLLMVHAPSDRPWARRVGIVLVVLSLMFVWFVAYLIEIHGEEIHGDNSGSWLYPGSLLLVGLGVSIPIARRFRSVVCAGIATVFAVGIVAMHASLANR